VAQLRRRIEELRNRLFDLIGKKDRSDRPAPNAGGIRIGGAAHAIWIGKMLKL
jgi:hypothetical protein